MIDTDILAQVIYEEHMNWYEDGRCPKCDETWNIDSHAWRCPTCDTKLIEVKKND
jgi:ssDNA-binding Zn-finger/Zn-ribbon topoisomerase 1